MKKLLFASLLIGASCSGFAAAAMWGASNVQSSGDPYVIGSTQYSAYLYVIADSVTYDSIINAWSSGDLTTAMGSAVASRSATATDSSGTAVMRFANQGYEGGKSGGYVKDDTVSAFMIIADGTTKENIQKYLVALYTSQGHADPVETVTFTAAGNQTLGWGSQSSNTDWKPIPEPASMSLLLVGLAGIGLRRKLKKAKKAA